MLLTLIPYLYLPLHAFAAVRINKCRKLPLQNAEGWHAKISNSSAHIWAESRRPYCRANSAYISSILSGQLKLLKLKLQIKALKIIIAKVKLCKNIKSWIALKNII